MANRMHEEQHKERENQKENKEKKEHTQKKINEFNVLLLLGIAVFGRLLLKEFPIFVSVEPIIPIAVYAGLVYGPDSGLLIGLLAYPISNLFLEGGLFGFWSVLQALGGGISGVLAGMKNTLDSKNLVYYSVIGTIIYEIIINIPDGAILIWPFSFIHVFSNLLFAFIIGSFIGKK